MSRFLSNALAMGAFIVLTSFALSRPSDPPRGGPAWTVSQYQLDRAFRVEFPISMLPLTLQAPATQGLIITQVKETAAAAGFTISVNGVSERFDFGGGNPPLLELNPPIIVRPGDVLTISAVPGSQQTALFTIAGYTTLPGET